jgi:hypothetical protein
MFTALNRARAIPAIEYVAPAESIVSSPDTVEGVYDEVRDDGPPQDGMALVDLRSTSPAVLHIRPPTPFCQPERPLPALPDEEAGHYTEPDTFFGRVRVRLGTHMPSMRRTVRAEGSMSLSGLADNV